MVRCVHLRTLKRRLQSICCTKLSPRIQTFTSFTLRQHGVHGVRTMTRRIVSMRTTGRTCGGSLSYTIMRKSSVRIGKSRTSSGVTQTGARMSIGAPTVTDGKSSSTTLGTTKSILASSTENAKSTIVLTFIRRWIVATL